MEKEFLVESNAIEGVFDDVSLEQAEYAWEYLKEQKDMSSHVVLKTHKILMLHSNLYPYEKGYFRRCGVRVGSHLGMRWEKVPDAISHWVDNVNDLVDNAKKEDKGFLERTIKDQHIAYEKTHPFIDGNGRTGRMYMNWTRLQLKLPLLVIHVGTEQFDYYKWFK